MKYTRRSTLVGVTGLLFAVVAAGFLTLASQLTPQSSAATSNPNKQFYIVGTKIVDPNNKIFVPIGANVGMKNGFDWNGTAYNRSAAAQAWGWNTVRLNFVCTSGTSYSLVNAKDGDRVLIAEIDRIVQEYTAKGIVVMLACHDSRRNENDSTVFWTNIANNYKSNPYVWFNYTNEPGWADNELWVRQQKQWLATIRATGAENIFVADVMNTGNDAGWAGAKRVFEPSMGPAVGGGQCNVLFSMHNYGGIEDNMKSSNYWQKVNDTGLAMVVGEFGYTFDNNNLNDQNHRGANATMDKANSYGIGMLMWHSTHGDKFYLTQPSATNPKPTFYSVTPGTQLTTFGKRFWDVSHNQPDFGSFAGDYAASNCATARVASAPAPTPPAAPVVTRPIGSTPSIPAPITTYPEIERPKEAYAPQVTTAAAATSQGQAAGSSSAGGVAQAEAPGITTGGSTSTTPMTGTDVLASQDLADDSADPDAIFPFMLAGQQITARTASVYGGGVSSAFAVLLFGWYFLSIRRDRHLYSQSHHQIAPMRAPKIDPTMTRFTDTDRLSSGEYVPGTVIKPKDK